MLSDLLGIQNFPHVIQGQAALTLRHRLLALRREDRDINWEGHRGCRDRILEVRRTSIRDIQDLMYYVEIRQDTIDIN